MRDKQVILENLHAHAMKLDPQHYELAAVAMIETEVQLDIRDILDELNKSVRSNIFDHPRES